MAKQCRLGHSCTSVDTCRIHPSYPADSDTLPVASNGNQGLGKPLTLSVLRRPTQTRKREVAGISPEANAPV